MKTISVDFDGVIHSYTSRYTDAYTIADPPVPGAIEWLTELTNHFYVVIFTMRVVHGGNLAANSIRKWLTDNGMHPTVVDRITFLKEKPNAELFIDDRGFHFAGEFPTVEWIKAFKPWNKQAT